MGERDGFGPAAWVRAAVVVGRLAEERAGLNFGRLDQHEVRRRASRRLGRPIIGDDPGLRVLLADLAQAPLTPLGRVWLRNELIRREVTEAGLRDEVRRRPSLSTRRCGGRWSWSACRGPARRSCTPCWVVIRRRWCCRSGSCAGPTRSHGDGWSGRPGCCGQRPWQDWPGRWHHGCGTSIASRPAARRRTSSCSATPACSPCRSRHPATCVGCRRPTRPRDTRPTIGTCRRCWRIGPGGGRC
jgi:hypothetical protein